MPAGVDYFAVCGGGAPANKIYENNSANSAETIYCRSHQIAIDVVLEMVERCVPPPAAAKTTFAGNAFFNGL